jgi:hypothetical protein
LLQYKLILSELAFALNFIIHHADVIISNYAGAVAPIFVGNASTYMNASTVANCSRWELQGDAPLPKNTSWGIVQVKNGSLTLDECSFENNYQPQDREMIFSSRGGVVHGSKGTPDFYNFVNENEPASRVMPVEPLDQDIPEQFLPPITSEDPWFIATKEVMSSPGPQLIREIS